MTTQNFDLVFHHLQALKMHAKENLTYGIDSPPHTNKGPYRIPLYFFLSSFFFVGISSGECQETH